MSTETSSDRELLNITFHFVNGQSQCFTIESIVSATATPQDARQTIRRFLKENWWAIKTPEKTIFINSANVLSYEVNTTAPGFEGEGVLHATLTTDIV